MTADRVARERSGADSRRNEQRLTLEAGLEGSFNVADKTATGAGSYAVMAGAT